MRAVQGISQIASLSGRVLDDGFYSGGLVKDVVDGVGYEIQTFVRRNQLEMASWVEVEHGQPQLFATAHLVKKSISRHVELLLVGSSEIDEIAVVGEDAVGCVSKLLTVGLEPLGFRLRDGRRFPTRRIACKQGKRLRSYGVGVDGCAADTFRGRYVGSINFIIQKYHFVLEFMESW